MGLFKLFSKGESSVVVEEPHQKVCQQMVDEGRILALFSKEGQYLVDHYGNPGEQEAVDFSKPFYLALNLNFVQSFYNTVKLGVSSSDNAMNAQASYKLVYHLGDDLVVQTNSKNTGAKVNLDDYEDGILLMLVKMPKNCTIQKGDQVDFKLQASMIFNPGELESFSLKLRT